MKGDYGVQASSPWSGGLGWCLTVSETTEAGWKLWPSSSHISCLLQGRAPLAPPYSPQAHTKQPGPCRSLLPASKYLKWAGAGMEEAAEATRH